MQGMIFPSVLHPALYIPELKFKRRESVLDELVGCVARAGGIRHARLLLETLIRREAMGCTAPGRGVAYPNARSLAVVEPRVTVARSRRGIEWGAPDGLPVQLVFLLLSPAESSEAAHHELIGRVAGLMKLQRNRQKVLEASEFESVAATLREALG